MQYYFRVSLGEPHLSIISASRLESGIVRHHVCTVSKVREALCVRGKPTTPDERAYLPHQGSERNGPKAWRKLRAHRRRLPPAVA